MILWYIDRFGLPGRYHSIWLTLLHRSGINPIEVRAISLHTEIKNRQLLTRYANRKAPTWSPDAAEEIQRVMRGHRDKFRPQAVVLGSPESLVCIGLAPEFATLHNLRGGVYRIDEIPHIVTLPISAWNTLVSQREIGAANYGFESQEDLKNHTVTMRSDASGTFSTLGDRLRNAESAEVHAALQNESHRNDGRPSLSGNEGHDSVGERLGPDASGNGEEDSIGGSTSDEPDEGESGDDDVREDSDPDESGTVSETEVVNDDDDLNEGDQFFYEPVLSPVGRFVITADTAKLKRILDKGVNSHGPKEPYTLRYR